MGVGGLGVPLAEPPRLAQVFDAQAMWSHATALLTADPLALVESVPEGEGHFLVRGGGGGGAEEPVSGGRPAVWRYRVGPVNPAATT